MGVGPQGEKDWNRDLSEVEEPVMQIHRVGTFKKRKQKVQRLWGGNVLGRCREQQGRLRGWSRESKRMIGKEVGEVSGGLI